MPKTKIDVELPREINREIYEHEVLLSFRSDEHAEYFHYWWDDEGLKAFTRWFNNEQHNGR